jgi:hypothetical protein
MNSRGKEVARRSQAATALKIQEFRAAKSGNKRVNSDARQQASNR